MKVQENTSSYTAELAILDAIKCKGKEMKTRFHPDICPNKVAIYFQGAERWDTYLLPIIEGSCELENTLRSWRHCCNGGTLFLDFLPTLLRLRRQKRTYNIPPVTQVSVKSDENRVGG